MKQIAMTLLATAIAVPMMFAADAPQTDPASPGVKMAKKHKKDKKDKKTKAALVASHAVPVK